MGTESPRNPLFAAAVLVTLASALPAEDRRPGRLAAPRLDRLEHLTSKNGLAHNWILELHQDRRGFLWIGTGDGLHRYDGYRLKIFRGDPEDPRTLADNRVGALWEDRRGDLWVGTRRGLHRLDGSNGTFTRYLHDPEDPGSLSDDYVLDILEDSAGDLWIATRSGLNRLGPSSSTFERFDLGAGVRDGPGGTLVRSIHESGSGELWFGAEGSTLHRFDRSSGRFQGFPLLEGGAAEAAGTVRSIAEDAAGRLWSATGSALVRFDPRTGERKRYLEGTTCFAVLAKRDGTVWVGTQSSGLAILEPGAGSLSVYRHDPDDPGTVSAGRIMTLFEDRTGITWIGTDAGLDKFVPALERFSLYRHRTGDPGSLDGNFVASVEEDSQGRLWIGGAGTGVTVLDRARGVKRRYVHDPEDPHTLASNDIVRTFEDGDGTIWVGSFRGVDRYDAERDRFVHLEPRPGDADGRVEGMVYAFAESGDGALWLGGVDGLFRLEKSAMRLTRYRHDPGNPDGPPPGSVYDLLPASGGDLWVGMGQSGLSRFDRERTTFRHYRHDPADPGSLSHDAVSTLHESRAGELWVGTIGGGLNRFEPAAGTFTRYREKDGLPNDQVWSILEDDRGHLWLSSSGGLTRFDPLAGTMENFDVRDGLQDNVFIIGSADRGPSGEMFFGGPSGLTAFFPDHLERDPFAPAVAITEFLLFNRATPLSERLAPGSAGGGSVPHLVLDHRDDVFAFEFAALHFAKPGKNRYAYKLEGFDRGWVEAEARRRVAQYTNLDPGDYVFSVRASNPDGVWNESGTSVRLTVLPPPWRTWWAYSLYVAVLAAAVSYYARSHAAELRRERQAAERERRLNAQLREVDQLKDEFLANTSHELRTPLYGITGLVESLIDGVAGELPEAARGHLALVAASGRRLSALVGDILDFSKLKHRSLELELGPVDLYALVDVVLALLRPLVGPKDIEIANAVAPDLPPAMADENRLQQILHNLVGNAIKFTDSGRIEVAAAERSGRLEVRVSDTGIGIPQEHRQRIFDAFVQVDGSIVRELGGTGLGLAVTRQLVELHGGSLGVDSAEGRGSSFYFDLPVAAGPPGRPALRSSPSPALVAGLEPGAGPAPETTPGSAPTASLLVVDDEPVIRQVLVNQLAAEGYAIAQAASGPEALQHLREHDCDLVLLDVMMPRMSGYEVCRTLRRRFTLDELPVIFLTAKNQVEDLVVGLAAGANDYLPKPISRSELGARVRTHLALLKVHRQLSLMVEERDVRLEERETLLAERERLIGELEARNADLALFNYTVSHDLRNPLVTIKTFLGALRHDVEPRRDERLEHHLRRLETAADQMHRLLEELYELSQVGVLANAPETVAFGDLVAEALEDLSELIAERGVEFEVDAGMPVVSGDRPRLIRLVRHLIENAVKHLGEQAAPRIAVGVERPEAGCHDPVFFVRDNGQGIEPYYHERIFGLFERLAPESSDGTGIGLALAKRIVEVHGGKIWVESRGAGHGSTFRFTLSGGA